MCVRVPVCVCVYIYKNRHTPFLPRFLIVPGVTGLLGKKTAGLSLCSKLHHRPHSPTVAQNCELIIKAGIYKDYLRLQETSTQTSLINPENYQLINKNKVLDGVSRNKHTTVCWSLTSLISFCGSQRPRVQISQKKATVFNML